MVMPDTSADASYDGDEIYYSSAMSMSKAIRAKRLSSVEAVQACLARIEEVNPSINAVVTSAAQFAIEEARRADAELREVSCVECFMACR